MAQYFDANPEAESSRRIIEYRAEGINFRFNTDTAVFSKSAVDKGTDLLIDTVVKDIRKRGAGRDERLLDLGCGWGVVGIVMKAVFTLFDVTMVDVNSRAVALAKENAGINPKKPDKIVQSDVLSSLGDDELFDIVMTNPPVRAGKKVVFSFYEQAFAHMNEGGSIYVVLQRKQGAESTFKKLSELFGNCETLSIEGGYRVMKSVKEAK